MEMLVRHFITTASQKMKIPIPEISREALMAIKKYHWPGNVRQLENSIVYAVSMVQDGTITIDDLPEEVLQTETTVVKTAENEVLTLTQLEKIALERALKTSQSTKRAAEALGIGRTTLYRKAREYGIELPE